MNHQQNWEAIILEVQRLRESGCTIRELAQRLRRSNGYVSKLLKNSYTGENMNSDKIREFMRRLGIGALYREDEYAGSPEGFELVRKVSARLGAGSSLLTENETEGLYAFREEFMRRLGPNAKPVLFGVMGQSMAPTLQDGDTVLVDEGDKVISSGNLYAVGIGDELHIKRVFVRPDKTIMLKSDNPDFPSFDIPKDERPRIIGRAKWVGRML